VHAAIGTIVSAAAMQMARGIIFLAHSHCSVLMLRGGDRRE
jgi:hypothetical protein